MREGLAYKIVGGVRFYERKEIKDALSYLRLIINPHDDVSLRRVINVPARGIGKGVMEAVENLDTGPDDPATDDLPLLAAGLQPTLAANSLWAKIVRGLERRDFTGRAAASLTVFRDLIVTADRGRAPGQRVDRARKILDEAVLRPARGSGEDSRRASSLAELVKPRNTRPTVRRPSAASTGSLLSDVDEEQGDRRPTSG